MTGFLDSGKTQFLTFTLEQDYFQIQGKTLLILCEEGEEEYDPKEMLKYGVVIEKVEDKEDLTEAWLEEMNRKHKPERVVVEYNGMWPVSDFEKLAFTRAEFSLDMQNRVKAVEAILHKKPLGLRFRPQEVSYLVTYKEQNGKTYLNYIRNEIRFKCDWKKRLFSSSYTVFSEMVVTDRKSDFAAIPSKKAFKEKQVFYDLVDEYWNEDFWKTYNIIEPTESLEHAVSKLKKQSR